ncbi:MAG: GNAT family N-acetyltransferase [Flavobacteriaceae bacterium]|nr:GNAT family N-acetyltransferase [Flavobacteriaceae bacterium]
MNLNLKQMSLDDLDKALSLFKSSAEKIAKKNVDHWQYWKNPPVEKIKWVKEGLSSNEFFFITIEEDEIIGMVRIMDEDKLYWGENDDKAKYIHSLVVLEKYEGNGIGAMVISKIENQARDSNNEYLRLDCDSKNPRLCEYYKELGFTKVGQKTLPISVYNLYQKNLYLPDSSSE